MHDYVIVGAGSAGCVLANRLSEDPSVRVLLLEAGGSDRSLNIKIPAAFPKQFHTKLDWDFATEPEPSVDGRSLYIPRGKALGGSSSTANAPSACECEGAVAGSMSCAPRARCCWPPGRSAHRSCCCSRALAPPRGCGRPASRRGTNCPASAATSRTTRS